MQYRSIDEIKKVIEENPIPVNFSELERSEQEKYYQIIEDSLSSCLINHNINLSSLEDIIFRYVPPEVEINESFRVHYATIVFKIAQKLQSEILELSNNGKIYSTNDIEFLISFLNFLADNARKGGLRFEVEEQRLRREYQSIKNNYQIKNKLSDFIKLVKQGERFEDVARLVQAFSNQQDLIEFYKKARAIGVSDLNICNSFNELKMNDTFNVLVFNVLRDIIKKNKSSVFMDYVRSNPNLYAYFIVIFVLRDDYKWTGFKKFCANFPRNSEDDNNLIEDNFDRHSKGTDEQMIKAINILYNNNLISDDWYDVRFDGFTYDDDRLYLKYQRKSIPKTIIKVMGSRFSRINEDTAKTAGELYGHINRCLYERIFEKIANRKPNFVKFYKMKPYESYISPYKIALKKGAKIDNKILVDLLVNNIFILEDIEEIIFKRFHIKPFDRSVLRSYSGDTLKLMESFEMVDHLLNLSNINRDAFIIYTLACTRNWLDDIIYISKNNKVNDFVKVKEFFFKYYYKLDNQEMSVAHIKCFIDILKNYVNYSELCTNIVGNELSEEDISRIKALFDNEHISTKDDGTPITNKYELVNIQSIIFNNYRKALLKALDSENIETVANILCEMLFNMSYDRVLDNLKGYGSVKDLRQLLFDNRENTNISKDIIKMLTYVSMMEDITNCDNINALKDILRKVINDEDTYMLCQKCNMLFRNFEEAMNLLYAKEINANLTDINNLPDTLIDQELTNKYGVKFFDLSSSKYCIMEHVKSNSETVDALVKGIANGNQLFISLSPGSNRNQKLYNSRSNDIIIFGCSSLPIELFIKSSTVNIGSNTQVDKYNYEVDLSDCDIKERGILETSAALEGHNSEILCYRNGLKFDCIVIPGSREPTDTEIEIAKKHNLSFVRVQELNTTISNPKPITEKKRNEHNHQIGEVNNELLPIQNILHESLHNARKKIAIFTDAHGLFEPTLAILEDARKNGITEIYSLGDNIGTGPNPKEVMDLLEAYNVKSLKGNHEMYALGELEKLVGHISSDRIAEEVKRNREYAEKMLTSEQLAKIKDFPEDMVIDIGDKKVMLSHYMRDYNTNEQREIPDEIDRVFQGHVHAAGEEGKITTLRGAGIGGEKGVAKYIVLTEKPGGGYDVDVNGVMYDERITNYDIIESDMNDIDKDKITSWIGRGK